MRLIVVLVSFMLAFSVNAQPLTFDHDVRSTSAMSESSVSVPRTQPVGFTPIGRRAATPPTEPSVWFNFQAAIIMTDAFSDNLLRVGTAFPSVPIGTIAERKIWRNGELFSHTTEVFTVLGSPGYLWWCEMWRGPIPLEWGDVVFELILTAPNRRRGRAFTVFSSVSSMQMRALSDSSGGVLLVGGLFLTEPFVARFPEGVAAPVEGRNYIPPSAGVKAGAILTICPGVDGNPLNLECATVTVESM